MVKMGVRKRMMVNILAKIIVMLPVLLARVAWKNSPEKK